ncbi:unnamed protein product [Adineta ricciae]|uniref:LITAF domain-containing protein n=1 Tax=Adineta ricciae TaxID=249248 RepID=A0A815GE25_ADIRI|nr:unnamed protein product [Adineta ricciae]
MQSYGDAPPPYPGINVQPSAPIIVTSKGDYQGVPVYEFGSSNAPVYGQTTYPVSPSMMQPSQTVIRPGNIQVGHNPVHCICPQCHQQIVSRVDYESGSFAWLMCLLLTVIGCIPCCIIPFCASSCQDVTHSCPNCSASIGRRKIL